MDFILLRFEGPLMSFGSVRVDQKNGTDRFPYRAMITGLLANALGYDHLEAERHAALQARIRYGARIDRAGELLVDYHTVDFGKDGPLAEGLGWTANGRVESRKGGDASDGTHIRFRHYLADAAITLAIALDPSDALPVLGDIATALVSPARPLFLGRKCCVPSSPLYLGMTTASSLREALEGWPRMRDRRGNSSSEKLRQPLAAIWPDIGAADREGKVWPRVEDRDWHNAIHVGRRIYIEGLVDPPDAVDLGPGATVSGTSDVFEATETLSRGDER